MATNEDFDILVGELVYAYKQFCIAKEISLAGHNEVFKRNVLLWNTIRLSLTRGYLAELAKIFEKNREDNILSIYYLLDFQFKENKHTIDKLRTIRNKFLMHNDIQTRNALDNFMKRLGLKPIDDIEALFKRTVEVLVGLRKEYGLSGDIQTLFREAETGARGDIKNLIERMSSSP